ERCIASNDVKNRTRGGTAYNVGNLSTGSDPRGGSPAACAAVADQNGTYLGSASTTGDWTGTRWSDGGAGFQMFQTILPPNGPSCSSSSWDGDWGVNSASSYHSGGVNVVMGDGAVPFISDRIDTGSLTSPEPMRGPSPFGVWGALGSKNAGDIINSAF
ncbi:MAG TPA: DUF1559 domain-containing protein, partial [Pirellulales bacterium]